MLSLDNISRLLLDRKLHVVAEATGLHYNTIKALRDKTSENPSFETVRKVSDYLEPK